MPKWCDGRERAAILAEVQCPAKWSATTRAIDAAYEVDEVKDIREKALAIEEYSAGEEHRSERRAREISLRAERKAGRLLREMEKAKSTTGQLSGGSVVRPPETPKTLTELGSS